MRDLFLSSYRTGRKTRNRNSRGILLNCIEIESRIVPSTLVIKSQPVVSTTGWAIGSSSPDPSQGSSNSKLAWNLKASVTPPESGPYDPWVQPGTFNVSGSLSVFVAPDNGEVIGSSISVNVRGMYRLVYDLDPNSLVDSVPASNDLKFTAQIPGQTPWVDFSGGRVAGGYGSWDSTGVSSLFDHWIETKVGDTFTVNVNSSGYSSGSWVGGSGDHHGEVTVEFALDMIPGKPTAPLSDIHVVSLNKSADKKNFSVSYNVVGNNLITPTIIELYWARGSTLDSIVGKPIYSKSIANQVGTYTINIDSTSLGVRPSGAINLIAVADLPNNAIESDEMNNLVSTTVPRNWEPKDSSVIVSDKLIANLDLIADHFFAATGKKLVITDGFRTVATQASAIYSKLKKDGVIKVQKLYSNKLLINSVIKAYRNPSPGQTSLEAITFTIQNQVNQGKFISKHLQDNAFDVRSSTFRGLKDYNAFRRAVSKAGMVIVPEVSAKDPHYHVQSR